MQPSGDPARLREIADTARAAARMGPRAGEWLAEHESKELLRAGGVAVVAGRLVAGEDDAVAALHELGGPIALKLSAPAVQHKSELGGVALGLAAEPDVRLAYRRLAPLADAYGGAVLAERMAAPGVELLIAARTGAVVPALVIGLGGIWTELLDDVAIIPSPRTPRGSSVRCVRCVRRRCSTEGAAARGWTSVRRYGSRCAWASC